VPLSRTLDSFGPMTRSVEDAALIYRALSGPDPDDAATAGIPAHDPWPALKRGVAGLRLGVLPEGERGDLDAEVGRAYADAVAVLARLGARIAELPFGAVFGACAERTGLLIASEAYAFLRETVEHDGARLDPAVRQRLLAGRGVTFADYLAAQDARAEAKRDLAQRLDGVDALLTPTSPIPPIPLDRIDETATPLARFTRAVNYLDLCALALPCGFTARGLPLSLQIVARGFAEDVVLRVGWAYENATPWHRRRPFD
jgi:aspartyl-tRNA(Asn)/glutamyl-tRNA(Gln) amidotransferase subunit A